MAHREPVRGETYSEILHYWAPELVSAAILYTLPLLLDSIIVAQLGSTSTYGILGVANNFLHMLTKTAESFSVATLTLVGMHNGAKEYNKVGQTFGNAFWAMFIIGFIPFFILSLFPTFLYQFLDVPHDMIARGVQFLQLRALGILLLFIYLSFFGFLKGIKNTKTPMQIYVVGILIFSFLDYALVLGKFGFPQLRLIGSAIATIVQYSVIIVLCIVHILTTPAYRHYFAKPFFSFFDINEIVRIVIWSAPIFIDKLSLAYSYVHLNKMINPMGKYAIASYAVVKDLERFALLPAVAFATVITFLVSNRLGAGDVAGARANIRKILKLGGIMVMTTLGIICINPVYFAQFFDVRNKFSGFVGSVFPIISLLVIFDFIQIILCGALRGAGDVRAVMIIRSVACFLFFIPISSWIASLPVQNEVLKFTLIYGSFYITTGLIGLLCIVRIKTSSWNKPLLSE